jgi:hypothetical protein
MNWLTPCISAAVQPVVRIEIVALRETRALQAERGLLSIYQKMQAMPMRRPRLKVEEMVSKSHSLGEYIGWRLYSVEVELNGSEPTSETWAGSYG